MSTLRGLVPVWKPTAADFAEIRAESEAEINFGKEFIREWGFGGPEYPQEFHPFTKKLTNLEDDALLGAAKYAIEQKNLELNSDKKLSLVKIVSAYRKSEFLQITHYVMMEANDPSGKKIICRAQVFTCWMRCHAMGEFSVAPYGKELFGKISKFVANV